MSPPPRRIVIVGLSHRIRDTFKKNARIPSVPTRKKWGRNSYNTGEIVEAGGRRSAADTDVELVMIAHSVPVEHTNTLHCIRSATEADDVITGQVLDQKVKHN